MATSLSALVANISIWRRWVDGCKGERVFLYIGKCWYNSRTTGQYARGHVPQDMTQPCVCSHVRWPTVRRATSRTVEREIKKRLHLIDRKVFASSIIVDESFKTVQALGLHSILTNKRMLPFLALIYGGL